MSDQYRLIVLPEAQKDIIGHIILYKVEIVMSTSPKSLIIESAKILFM